MERKVERELQALGRVEAPCRLGMDGVVPYLLMLLMLCTVGARAHAQVDDASGAATATLEEGSPEVDADDAPAARTSSPMRRFAVSVAYYGEFLSHPGIALGADVHLLQHGPHALVASSMIGGYVHNGNHLGLFVLPEVGYRATASFGLYGEALAGVGYHHALADGPTYRRVDGTVQEVVAFGQPSLLLSASLGVGWDVTRNAGPPIRFFTRGQLSARYPYNHSFLVGFAALAGVAFQAPWRF